MIVSILQKKSFKFWEQFIELDPLPENELPKFEFLFDLTNNLNSSKFRSKLNKAMLSVKQINSVVAHHQRRGTSPKCSAFRFLPHDLIIGIVKYELDRQKEERDTLDYWKGRCAVGKDRAKLVPRSTRYGRTLPPWTYYQLVMRDILALGVINTIVQKADRTKRKKDTIRTQSTYNFTLAIIRKNSSIGGSTLRSIELRETNVLGYKWFKMRLASEYGLGLRFGGCAQLIDVNDLISPCLQ